MHDLTRTLGRADRIRRSESCRRGFTLVELMIVLAVLAIVVTLAIPNFMRAKAVSNEGSALASLRTISTMSERYRTRFSQYAGNLGDLENAGLIDENLGGGSKAGFTFTYAGTVSAFTCTADPETPGTSGTRYFFVDTSGVIRFSTTGTANSTSTPIGD